MVHFPFFFIHLFVVFFFVCTFIFSSFFCGLLFHQCFLLLLPLPFFLLLLSNYSPLLGYLLLVCLHVLFDFIDQPILVIIIKGWLLHFVIDASQQSFTVLSGIESGVSWLRQVVFRAILCAQRLFFKHAEVVVLGEDYIRQLTLDIT